MSTRRARVVTAGQWGIPERDAEGRPVCRWCRAPVAPPRRTFCGEGCVHEWKIRSSPWYVRREVKKRDKGICRLCGVNVVKAHREWTRGKPPPGDRAARKKWREARPRWEADHIVPVADGGGECGLENYRLLCRACHVRVTVEWRTRRRAGPGQESAIFSSHALDQTPRPRAVPRPGGAAGAAALAPPRAVGQSVGPPRDPS